MSKWIETQETNKNARMGQIGYKKGY